MGRVEIGENARQRRREDEQERCPPRLGGADDHEQERPERVELLFDAQRPGMIEDPGIRVHVIGRERERVGEAAKARDDGARTCQHRDRREIDPVSGQDAQATANVEPEQVDGARLVLLGDEQAGDEKPADHEEDGHADGAPDVDHAGPEQKVAANLQQFLGMAEDHHRRRDPAQPVE